MLDQENLYVLTFSTDQPDKYSKTFDQVIATFDADLIAGGQPACRLTASAAASAALASPR